VLSKLKIMLSGFKKTFLKYTTLMFRNQGLLHILDENTDIYDKTLNIFEKAYVRTCRFA